MIELAPQPKERMNFDTAWLYCATLTYKNKYDWRIPTNAEVRYNEEIDEDSFDQLDEVRLVNYDLDHYYSQWRVQPVRTL
jgi:hypothetical protein